MEKSKGLKVLIAILVVIVLGLGGYLIYDKVIEHKDKGSNTSSETNADASNLTGKYAYYGLYNNVADLHVELELKSDNSFALSLGYASDGGYFTGNYTLDGDRLTLNATLRNASNADYSMKESLDTFDCSYNKTNNTITFNKWNYNYIDGDKLIKEVKIEYNGTLNLVDNFKYLNNNSELNNITIKNAQVKELYGYTSASLISDLVCLGYFYQNPFKNHTLEDKISLVIINYAAKFATGSLYKKLKSSYVKEGMKKIFNINVSSFDTNKSYSTWTYDNKNDEFIQHAGGGGYQADIKQQIIEYNELNDEINLTVVKAELGYDGNVYRYVNNKNTLVYENGVDEFEFTNTNISKFPQLKYIFEKKENGKYYVADIINLNYTEDFEKCD